MNKHLRKFLSLLAIMLALSFSWSSAQNMSSAKQLLSFKFEKTSNAQLQSDVMGVINQTNRTVIVTVPFTTNVTELKATFTSSEFSKVFFGSNPNVGTLATSSVTTWNYIQPVTLTVQAENLSYENYFVTVSTGPPSTANSLVSFSGIWTKIWTGSCTPNGALSQNQPATITGNNVILPVPFGTDLDSIIVHFEISPYATCNFTDSIQDFDADNNGAPEVKVLTVTSQSGVVHNYNVLPVVGNPNVEDNLLTFIVPNSLAPAVVNYTTQSITAVVPFSATYIAPMWIISPYAHMYSNSQLTDELCPGTILSLTEETNVFHFWIQAEMKSEVSEFILTVTKAVAKTDCTLTYISANYTKPNLCGENYTGIVVGTIVNSNAGNTITFNVPFGINSGVIDSLAYSALASSSDSIGVVIDNSNQTVVITAEDGVTTKTYTIIANVGTASNSKQLLTFGFNRNVNNGFGFTWADSTYAGTIDQALKRIHVTVPYNTNLYQLKAYFTQSIYSCVSIAESNGTYTPQFSECNINNFSNTLTYVVTAEDGTQERYEVFLTKTLAKTGNDLLDFQISLFDCFDVKYYVPGTYSDNNNFILVSVKYGTVLDSIPTTFTVSDGATVFPEAGFIDYTNPVNITVTSQAEVAKSYTVIVLHRGENSEKKLLSFWFDSDNNTDLTADITGTIDEGRKRIDVKLPKNLYNSIYALKASFTLSDGSLITNEGEFQFSGLDAHNYLTPVVFEVWAENCTSEKYYVWVDIDATGINDNKLENVFNVFPNPAFDKFTISFNLGKSADMSIRLVNMTGQTVYSKELKNIQNHNEEINVNEFSKGIYYLRVNDGSDTQIKKIIIQ